MIFAIYFIGVVVLIAGMVGSVKSRTVHGGLLSMIATIIGGLICFTLAELGYMP